MKAKDLENVFTAITGKTILSVSADAAGHQWQWERYTRRRGDPISKVTVNSDHT